MKKKDVVDWLMNYIDQLLTVPTLDNIKVADNILQLVAALHRGQLVNEGKLTEEEAEEMEEYDDVDINNIINLDDI